MSEITWSTLLERSWNGRSKKRLNTRLHCSRQRSRKFTPRKNRKLKKAQGKRKKVLRLQNQAPGNVLFLSIIGIPPIHKVMEQLRSIIALKLYVGWQERHPLGKKRAAAFPRYWWINKNRTYACVCAYIQICNVHTAQCLLVGGIRGADCHCWHMKCFKIMFKWTDWWW